MRATPISFSPSLKQDIVQLVPPDPRHLQPITANERKLSHVIITSKDEPPVDVECKSESKPLFFKPLFSRLQSNPRTEIRTARKRRHMLECRNQSSLKIKESFASESMLIEKKKPTRRELPTEQPDDLTASASNYHPSTLLAKPDIQNYRDIVQQYYNQQYLMPAFNSILQPTDSPTFPTIKPHVTFEQKHHELHKPNSSRLNSENLRLHFSDGINLNLGKQNIAQMSAVPRNEPSKKNKQTSYSQNFLQFKAESLLNTTEVTTSVAVLLKEEMTEKPQQFVIEVNSNENRTSARSETPIATKIILKPLAKAKAGSHGVAISSPISTAYIKRGDYVEIEYLPEATADVGEGGVAISKPELIIHFIDRRRK